MTRTLFPRDRRAIIMAAVIVVPALAFTHGVRPFVRALGERRDAVATQRELLSRERSLVDAIPRYAAPTTAIQASLATEMPRTVRSAARATATVQFSDHVREVARGHEVLIVQSNDIQSDSLAPGVLLLRLAIRAESDLAGLLRFLSALERDSQRIRITRLHIERAPAMRAGGDVSGDRADVLILNATVEAPAVLTSELAGRTR